MAITPASTWTPDIGVPYPFRFHRPRPEELEKLSDAELQAWAQSFDQIEANAKEDPVKWGWQLPNWRKVLAQWHKYHTHVILGGNRSTKSSLCSRIVVAAATEIPGARVRCWSINEDSSINDQQKMVWEAVPARFRALKTKRGARNYGILYTQRNGFSGGKVVFPPPSGNEDDEGGELIFQTYKSYSADPQVAEGWWAHVVWCDEEMPQKLFETMQYRLKDAKGRLLLSFTTLNGWTPLISDILAKTRTLEKRYSNLVGRELPVLQESLSRPGTAIWYFWTEDNPFIDWRDFLKDMVPRPLEEKLARAHGVPVRSVQSKFPLFDDTVHVVKHEDLPWLKERRTKDGKELPAYTVTRYMALDPAGRKSWFMLWVAIDAAGTYWIYREWPDESMGDWAEPGNDAKGKCGPAQRGQGFGIRDYVELVQDLESGEDTFERYIDSRMGTAEKQAKEGATSILSELEEEGMLFLPASGLDIDHGLQLINDELAYDTSEPLSATNSPNLYVSDRCQNLIFALKNFTGEGGREEACKDPIDCLRYLLEAGMQYVDKKSTEVVGVGGY